jgi:hypothetical protein
VRLVDLNILLYADTPTSRDFRDSIGSLHSSVGNPAPAHGEECLDFDVFVEVRPMSFFTAPSVSGVGGASPTVRRCEGPR